MFDIFKNLGCVLIKLFTYKLEINKAPLLVVNIFKLKLYKLILQLLQSVVCS